MRPARPPGPAARSTTVTSRPAPLRRSAAASPARPAPTTTIRSVRPGTVRTSGGAGRSGDGERVQGGPGVVGQRRLTDGAPGELRLLGDPPLDQVAGAGLHDERPEGVE